MGTVPFVDGDQVCGERLDLARVAQPPGVHAADAGDAAGERLDHADRLPVVADVDGSSFNEVTFLAKVGTGAWEDIGTDDSRPYRVFHDVADVDPGTTVSYRAVVLDNADHTRSSNVATSTVAPARANVMAQARPMPEPPPVTIALRPPRSTTLLTSTTGVAAT